MKIAKLNSKHYDHKALDEKGIAFACIELGKMDMTFKRVIDLYGYPPLWARPQGFATLVQIILEQQVSLASAKACFDKLNSKIGDLTPQTFLSLNDTELKDIGFSRQKTAYSRHLAEKVISNEIELDSFDQLDDNNVRTKLIELKGIGPWTADIYLLMAMLRPDIMPKGDIALHAAWQKLSGEPRPSSDGFLEMAANWSPHRSTAARLLWHFYLSDKAMQKNK